ncbi:heterokaryon incompatibility protein-domain-containing protein, partial [Bisporella sp. PMI_857]
NTGSPAATKWAADRLDQCVNNHSLCANDRDSILPTRVLDIMPGNPVQLYEPKEGEKGTYCSLSHCWGPTQPIITTIKNFEARKHGVPWPLLSQTFQDAIKFTRALGIRYIWIDSLCIIQDDPEDWKRESAKMYKIYTHSILTLAATKSSDGYGGCFTISDSAYRGYEVRDEYEGKTANVHVRKKLQHDFYRENMQAEEQLPLLGRGWALQERFLPPRVLHFGPQELFWECITHFCCECGTAELEKPSRKSEFHSALSKESDLALSRFWRDLVVGYSRLKFTFESDRLQAFRGIAELFKRHRGFEADQYVSGIWKESIIDDLLWSVHLTQLKQQPKRNAFPTWCWAA